IALQHRGNLPRQVHGVADTGVHPLSTDRAVDVGGVAEEERAPVPKMKRNAMVHAIGREPVNLLDVELEVLEGFASHVLEVEFVVIALWKIVDGSDQTDSSRLLKRKKQKEVRIFDVGVEAVVHRR